MDIIEWHASRAKNIGSSEVAVLFGCSPWMTEYHLWHIKRGTLPYPELTSEVVAAGKHLEIGLASWAAEKWDWALTKGEYQTSLEGISGMGCSPDYIENGTGDPVEFKFSEFGEGWEFQGDEIVDAPVHYLLQVQHQISCLNKQSGWLVAYKNGTLRRMKIARNEALIAEMKKRIGEFWFTVEVGFEPAPDYKRDCDIIALLRTPIEGGGYADITGNNRAHELLTTMERAKVIRETANDDYETSKAELLHLLGKEKTIRCGEWLINSTTIKENTGKVITQEMVGTVTGVRKGYVRVDFKKTEI